MRGWQWDAESMLTVELVLSQFSRSVVSSSLGTHELVELNATYEQIKFLSMCLLPYQPL